MLNRLQGDWPYPARRSPIFYGWVIWLLSTLGFLLSVPGQTMGMGVFTDSFIDALGLTRTQLSGAYFWGTLGSALLLTRAGRAYDRLGARTMMLSASIGLALVLLVLANLEQFAATLAQSLDVTLSWITLPAMFLCYFGVRFTGQGVLTSASVNVLLVWFERRRGLVVGIRGVFISLGFAIAPLVLAQLIDALSWRGALLALAAIVGVAFSLLVLLTVRDDPAVCGLSPDGRPMLQAGAGVAAKPPGQTLSEARRTLEYWAYCLGLAIHALFGTAMTFHIVDIFAEANRGRDAAFGYFLPAAIVSTSVNLIASTLADRFPLKPYLLVMLGAFALGAWGMLQLDTALGYWLLVAGFGAGGGLWAVISNLAFVRHHGAAHLGEISGFNTSITVFASALGPVAFSLARDYSGSYHSAIWVCLIAILLLALLSTRIRNRGRP